MIHKVQHGLEVRVLDPLEVEEGVLVGGAPQDVPEEGRAGGQDDLVGLQLLLVITGQGHVKEVLVLAQLAEGHADVALEVVPPEAELLRPHLGITIVTHFLKMAGYHCWLAFSIPVLSSSSPL